MRPDASERASRHRIPRPPWVTSHGPSAMAGGANRPNQVPLSVYGRTSALCSQRWGGGGWFSCARKPASVGARRANDQCGDKGPGPGSRTCEGVEPMGRGRAKAKQVKVARQLKYSGGGTDLNRLRAELGVGTEAQSADHDDEDSLDDDAGDEDDDEEEDWSRPR